MKFEARPGSVVSIATDAVIAGIYEGEDVPGGAAGELNAALGGVIAELIKSGELKGKLNELHVLHTLGKIPARVVVLAGMGKRAEWDSHKLRELVGEAVRVLRKHRVKSAALALWAGGDGSPEHVEPARAVAEGWHSLNL